MRRFLTQASLPRSPQEVFKAIYRCYKWPPGRVASNIRNQLLTPMYPPLADPTAACQVSCSICYNFFPRVNETSCSAQHVCTECVAATIDPPGAEQICPFCRRPGFSVTANLQRWELRRRDEDDTQYEKFERAICDGFDFESAKGCSDEAIAAAMQFQTDPAEIQALLDQGRPIGDILHLLGRPRAAEPKPATPEEPVAAEEEVQVAPQPPEMRPTEQLSRDVIVISDSSDD
jgi:hypothetical protein